MALANAPADADGIDTLGEVADAVRASTAALQSTPAQVPVYAGLAARVAALRETMPEASIPFIDPAVEAARKAAERGDTPLAAAITLEQQARDRREQVAQAEQAVREQDIALELLAGAPREAWGHE